MKELSLQSPAKLNLFLHIIGKRKDGYHNLQTVFQFIDLHDEMHFKTTDSLDIILHCDHPQLSKEGAQNNLIYKAARLLQTLIEKTNKKPSGVEIFLKKNIPVGGGLGGGSSNAATTLLALNVLWGLNLSLEQLEAISIDLGADVPFFVYGKNAWAEDIGQTFTDITLTAPHFLIIKPDCHINTTEIFSNPRLTRDTEIMTIADFPEEQTRNDFESLVRKLYPEVDNALIWLDKFAPARLTGSGSCLFANMDSYEHAMQIKKQIPSDMSGFVSQGLKESPIHQALASFEANYESN